MTNPNPKPIPAHMRATRQPLSPGDPTVRYQLSMPESMHRGILLKGGATFVRKAIREELTRDPPLE